MYKKGSIVDPLGMVHERIAYYEKLYIHCADEFFGYLDCSTFATAAAGPQSYDKQSEYFLNNMELALLKLVKTRIAINVEELKNPDTFIKILVEIFFIIKYKQLLNIPRPNDFVTNFSDKIYSIMDSFSAKLNPALHAELLFLHNVSYRTLSQFHQQIAFEKLQAFMQLAREETSKPVGMWALKYAWETWKLNSVIKAYIGSSSQPDVFRNTLRQIENAIQEREQKKSALEKKLISDLKKTKQQRFGKAFGNLKEHANQLLDEFDANAHERLKDILQILQMKDLTFDERVLMETEKVRLEDLIIQQQAAAAATAVRRSSARDA